MEPGVNLPNPKTFERRHGRVKVLQPGESYASDIILDVHNSSEGVAAVEAEVAAMLNGRETVVHPTPIAKWSAGA